jgi:hypothetical protein
MSRSTAGVFLGLPLLRSFSVESNLLARKVPGSLSSCREEVEYLNMANHSLHGTLDLFNFARLTRLRAEHIGWNRLTGHIPVNQWHQRVPKHAAAWDRQWRTPLRARARLSVLDLSCNRLAGHLPPWLGSFDALFLIDLSGNAMTGDIPLALTRLKALTSSNASDVQCNCPSLMTMV